MRCGWCDGDNTDAAYIDNGVGMQQVSAATCGDCGATQFNPYDNNGNADPEEKRRRWWRGECTDDFMLHLIDTDEWVTGDQWLWGMVAPLMPWHPAMHRWGTRLNIRGFVDDIAHDCEVRWRVSTDDHVFEARCGAIFGVASEAPAAEPTCIKCALNFE